MKVQEQAPLTPEPLTETAAGIAGETSALAGYGGFHLGGTELALPMAALREVVPCLALVALPCPAACVVGGIDLRGVLVPVVDLRIVLGREPGPTSPASVIVMVHEGFLLGLLVDGITGIFAHEPGSVSSAQYKVNDMAGAGPGASLYAGSLRRADTGSLVSVLSAEALSRLPQVPMTPDPAPQRRMEDSDSIARAHGAQTMPVVLIRCDRIAMAIDALAVHATLSDPTVHPSVLSQGDCRGVMDYAGRRIAAVDLLALCGLGRLQDASTKQAFVVKFEQGYVGLLVDAVLDVVNVQRQQVVPVPAFALPRPGLFQGALPPDIMVPSAVVTAGTGAQAAPLPQFLLLNAAALRDTPELTSLSQTNTLVADPQGREQLPAAAQALNAERADPTEAAAAGSNPANRREMITYELFGEEASPIDQVSEILRYEPGSAVFEPKGAFLGLMINRGRTIPVMCLRRLAGQEPVALDATSSVLVVQSETDWVGFAVPRLRAIETVHWSPVLPQNGMGDNDGMAQALGSREMALVNTGRGSRMLRVLDLANIAQRLRERAHAA